MNLIIIRIRWERLVCSMIFTIFKTLVPLPGLGWRPISSESPSTNACCRFTVDIIPIPKCLGERGAASAASTIELVVEEPQLGVFITWKEILGLKLRQMFRYERTIKFVGSKEAIERGHLSFTYDNTRNRNFCFVSWKGNWIGNWETYLGKPSVVLVCPELHLAPGRPPCRRWALTPRPEQNHPRQSHRRFVKCFLRLVYSNSVPGPPTGGARSPATSPEGELSAAATWPRGRRGRRCP